MIITISGMPGSGKSTIAKLVAKKLGYKHYSMGDLQGKLAQQHGMTIEAWNKLCLKNPETDRKVDALQQELGKKEDNFVIDGHISHHFIPHSLKIYLTVDLAVAARRIFNDPRDDETPARTIQDVEKKIRERIRNEQQRYKKHYNIDYTDTSPCDLVIDTTTKTPEKIIKEILTRAQKK